MEAFILYSSSFRRRYVYIFGNSIVAAAASCCGFSKKNKDNSNEDDTYPSMIPSPCMYDEELEDNERRREGPPRWVTARMAVTTPKAGTMPTNHGFTMMSSCSAAVERRRTQQVFYYYSLY